MKKFTESDTIKCEHCHAPFHMMHTHLKKCSSGLNIEQYIEKYPNAPLMSPFALQETGMGTVLEKQQEISESHQQVQADVATDFYENREDYIVEKRPMHEVLGIPEERQHLFKAANGNDIMLDYFVNTPFPEFTAEPLEAYHFEPDLCRDIAYALMSPEQLPIPVNLYLQGAAGTGKTSHIEQFMARCNRPCKRIQHHGTLEPFQIEGGMQAANGSTYFEMGELMIAVKYGIIYIADEIDLSPANVLACYQAVLERKPMVVPHADITHRITPLHKYFRFFGTGNTNLSGDETGIFAGAQQGNSALASRFVMQKVDYMKTEDEVRMIVCNFPCVDPEHAEEVVNFANKCRNMFQEGELYIPMSPRDVLSAIVMGSMFADFKKGIRKAYVNKLPTDEQMRVNESLEHHFD